MKRLAAKRRERHNDWARLATIAEIANPPISDHVVKACQRRAQLCYLVSRLCGE